MPLLGPITLCQSDLSLTLTPSMKVAQSDEFSFILSINHFLHQTIALTNYSPFQKQSLMMTFRLCKKTDQHLRHIPSEVVVDPENQSPGIRYAIFITARSLLIVSFPNAILVILHPRHIESTNTRRNYHPESDFCGGGYQQTIPFYQRLLAPQLSRAKMPNQPGFGKGHSSGLGSSPI